MDHASRREFLKSGVKVAVSTVALGSALDKFVSASGATQSGSSAQGSASTLSIKKGLVYRMLPSKLTHAERFRLAHDAG